MHQIPNEALNSVPLDDQNMLDQIFQLPHKNRGRVSCLQLATVCRCKKLRWPRIWHPTMLRYWAKTKGCETKSSDLRIQITSWESLKRFTTRQLRFSAWAVERLSSRLHSKAMSWIAAISRAWTKRLQTNLWMTLTRRRWLSRLPKLTWKAMSSSWSLTVESRGILNKNWRKFNMWSGSCARTILIWVSLRREVIKARHSLLWRPTRLTVLPGWS